MIDLKKALHSLVGFTPIGAQVGRNAATGMGRRGNQNVHPPSPSKPQIADFNKHLVDINNKAGTPLPIQPGSISNENPDGTWLRQQLGLQVGQPNQSNTGIQAWSQPQQGFGPQVQGVGSMPAGVQGMPGARNTRQLQRPSFNPQVEDQGYYYY